MPAPISTRGAYDASSPDPSGGPSLRSSGSGSTSFRDHLSRALKGLGESEHAVERALERVAHGGAMSPTELIGLQATMYRHVLKVDIASKLVEKSTSALRQALQSQS